MSRVLASRKYDVAPDDGRGPIWNATTIFKYANIFDWVTDIETHRATIYGFDLKDQFLSKHNVAFEYAALDSTSDYRYTQKFLYNHVWEFVDIYGRSAREALARVLAHVNIMPSDVYNDTVITTLNHICDNISSLETVLSEHFKRFEYTIEHDGMKVLMTVDIGERRFNDGKSPEEFVNVTVDQIDGGNSLFLTICEAVEVYPRIARIY
jgi:hypothetical protein